MKRLLSNSVPYQGRFTASTSSYQRKPASGKALLAPGLRRCDGAKAGIETKAANAPVRSESGLAMVLVISLVGLLSGFGVWLILQSETAMRMTKSFERTQQSFNFAEAALRLTYRALYETPFSPNYNALISSTPTKVAVERLPSYMKNSEGEAELPLGHGILSPSILYVRHSTIPPPGWMLNWQGDVSFHSLFYKGNGTGEIPISESRNARSIVVAFIQKLTR